MERPHRPGDTARCIKHYNRNPCVIEGCSRTTAAPWHEIGDGGAKFPVISTDDYFCGEHWRAFVPPRSPQRRIYSRFFRRAKKFDWNDASRAAFWRFWQRLVAQARAKSAGDIDEDEINKFMGWS